MKDLRKAAEQAIEAIMHGGVKEQAAAVYELRQALAQEEKPPVKSYCGGKPNYCTPDPHVDAVNMSQERVDETAKREHDCNKCENRGRVLGDSQESYCENCIYGSPWKKDYYKEKNA